MGENKHLKSDSIIESNMYRTCLSKKVCIELGMAMGRGGAEGWDLHPRPA